MVAGGDDRESCHVIRRTGLGAQVLGLGVEIASVAQCFAMFACEPQVPLAFILESTLSGMVA